MCIQCRDQCNTQSVIVFSFQLDNVTFNYFIETGLLTTADSTYMAPMQLICHDRTTTKQRSIRVCLCSSSLSSVLTTTMQFQAVVFWCCMQQQYASNGSISASRRHVLIDIFIHASTAPSYIEF